MYMSDDFPMMMEREAGFDERCPKIGVGFGLYPIEDGKKTQEAGYPVFKDVEFVKIVVPGEKLSMVFQPATDDYRRRFPEAYRAYKNREHTPTEGMPITEWAAISRSQAYTLKAMNVFTVEALAEVSDNHIDKLGGNARELREKAKTWLADAKGGAAALKVAEEKQALADELSGLKAQMAQVLEQLAQAQAENKPEKAFDSIGKAAAIARS